jgi:hypothetical protein
MVVPTKAPAPNPKLIAFFANFKPFYRLGVVAFFILASISAFYLSVSVIILFSFLAYSQASFFLCSINCS